MTGRASRFTSEAWLTAAQQATLSNTICGDVGSALELERMGYLRIRRISKRGRQFIAFFDLTDAGDDFVNRHFVVPLAD